MSQFGFAQLPFYQQTASLLCLPLDKLKYLAVVCTFVLLYNQKDANILPLTDKRFQKTASASKKQNPHS